MRPLTLDDLLPLDDYAGRRREFFAAHQHYLDRQRRVRIGPRLTLVFENRQTLWFRVQELVRIARLTEPARLQTELDLYNRLLPANDRLQAALLLHVEDESKLTEELAAWQTLPGDALRLHLGSRPVPADLLTCRAEDRCFGTSHWVQFHVSPELRATLLDLEQPVYLSVRHAAYQLESAPLSEEVRQSLHDDLTK